MRFQIAFYWSITSIEHIRRTRFDATVVVEVGPYGDDSVVDGDYLFAIRKTDGTATNLIKVVAIATGKLRLSQLRTKLLLHDTTTVP